MFVKNSGTSFTALNCVGLLLVIAVLLNRKRRGGGVGGINQQSSTAVVPVQKSKDYVKNIVISGEQRTTGRTYTSHEL